MSGHVTRSCDWSCDHDITSTYYSIPILYVTCTSLFAEKSGLHTVSGFALLSI